VSAIYVAQPLRTGTNTTLRGQAVESERLRAVEALVDLARELNDKRAPDHQERVAKAVASVREYFRDGEAGLPTDEASLLAQVIELFRASGSSPEGYGRTIDALALSLDESRNVSRRRHTSSPPRL
jgi:hypothetical protein